MRCFFFAIQNQLDAYFRLSIGTIVKPITSSCKHFVAQVMVKTGLTLYAYTAQVSKYRLLPAFLFYVHSCYGAALF